MTHSHWDASRDRLKNNLRARFHKNVYTRDGFLFSASERGETLLGTSHGGERRATHCLVFLCVMWKACSLVVSTKFQLWFLVMFVSPAEPFCRFEQRLVPSHTKDSRFQLDAGVFPISRRSIDGQYRETLFAVGGGEEALENFFAVPSEFCLPELHQLHGTQKF